jgi:hypothetical protein
VLYIRFLRGRGSFAGLERWQTNYLPVYAVWAAVVAIVFPPVFGFIEPMSSTSMLMTDVIGFDDRAHRDRCALSSSLMSSVITRDVVAHQNRCGSSSIAMWHVITVDDVGHHHS